VDAVLYGIVGGTIPSASLSSGGASGSGGSTSPGSPSSNSALASATFHITIPAPVTTTQSLQRRPQYIGAVTNELYISVGDPNFAPITTSSFTVDATNCTTNSDGSKNCTFAAQEPIGDQYYAFLGVSIANGVSLPLEVGAQQFVVTAGQNTLSATLDAIFAAVSLTALGQYTTLPPFALTLTLTDAASELIPTNTNGSLVSLPTIVDTDTSGQSSLSIPGFVTPTSSVQPVNLSQTQMITLDYTPSSATAPVDSFNIIVQTLGWSITNGLISSNFFPQAIPVPSAIPAMSSTYGVLCSPRNPVPNSPTYASPQPPVCYLTATAGFTVN
jgi:hypothetical protein